MSRTFVAALWTLSLIACVPPTMTADAGGLDPVEDAGAAEPEIDPDFDADAYPTRAGWCTATLDIGEDGLLEASFERDYDFSGRLASQTRRNIDKGNDYLEEEREWSYDPGGQLTRQEHRWYTGPGQLAVNDFEVHGYSATGLRQFTERGSLLQTGGALTCDEQLLSYDGDEALSSVVYNHRDACTNWGYSDPYDYVIMWGEDGWAVDETVDYFQDGTVDQRFTHAHEVSETRRTVTTVATERGDLDAVAAETVSVYEVIPPNPEVLLVEQRIDSPFDGEVDEIRTFTYDPRFPVAALRTYTEHTDADGNVLYWQERTYDDGGNILTDRSRGASVPSALTFDYGCY